VFLLGGVCGLCGTISLGPRIDIFSVINKRIKRGNLKKNKQSKVQDKPEEISNEDIFRKKSVAGSNTMMMDRMLSGLKNKTLSGKQDISLPFPGMNKAKVLNIENQPASARFNKK
jgi:hypothetical protein